jgi:hypothetical protein
MYRHPEEAVEQWAEEQHAAEYSKKTLTVVIIDKVKVWVNHDGHDMLHLYTSIPSPYPDREGEVVIVTTYVPANTGVEFCKQHFRSAEVEVVSPIRSVKNIY